MKRRIRTNARKVQRFRRLAEMVRREWVESGEEPPPEVLELIAHALRRADELEGIR